MTIKKWQDIYNETGCVAQTAMLIEIKELRTENEAVRQANLHCVENFRAIFAELEETKSKLVEAQASPISEESLDILRSENARLSALCAKLAASESQEPTCKPHPDAPHGFDRNGSHCADRYVCLCESWKPGDADTSL